MRPIAAGGPWPWLRGLKHNLVAFTPHCEGILTIAANKQYIEARRDTFINIGDSKSMRMTIEREGTETFPIAAQARQIGRAAYGI